MSINKVFISGNLTRDCELRVTKSGSKILTIGMAVNDRRRNPQTGEWEDCPNFIDCVLFGNRAESVSRFLAKGSKVAIEGKLRWSQWEKDGNRRSKIEVIVDEIEFMSRQGDSNAQNQPQQQHANNYSNQYQNTANTAPQQSTGYYPQPQAPDVGVYASDDIPF